MIVGNSGIHNMVFGLDVTLCQNLRVAVENTFVGENTGIWRKSNAIVVEF